MNKYEELIQEAFDNDIKVMEAFDFGNDPAKGLIAKKRIALSKELDTEAERTCILAEEIAHSKVNFGNITNINIQINKNRELRARRYAIENLTPFLDIVRTVINLGENATIYNVASELGITEQFLKDSLNLYESTYSGSMIIDNYLVILSPFRVIPV